MNANEHRFSEVAVDQARLEQFSLEMSAYYVDEDQLALREVYARFKRKLLWHIRHSLSPRQRETLLLILAGKTEREVGKTLGVTQQVVHIYKWRAIKKLQQKIAP